MESKNSWNCKRLKHDEDDGMRGEGNVTAACLAVPLLEEQISGMETGFYDGFDFRAALFLIDGTTKSAAHERYLFANSLNTNPIFTISFQSGE